MMKLIKTIINRDNEAARLVDVLYHVHVALLPLALVHVKRVEDRLLLSSSLFLLSLLLYSLLLW